MLNLHTNEIHPIKVNGITALTVIGAITGTGAAVVTKSFVEDSKNAKVRKFAPLAVGVGVAAATMGIVYKVRDYISD